jgi:hypothetical protein
MRCRVGHLHLEAQQQLFVSAKYQRLIYLEMAIKRRKTCHILKVYNVARSPP